MVCFDCWLHFFALSGIVAWPVEPSILLHDLAASTSRWFLGLSVGGLAGVIIAPLLRLTLVKRSGIRALLHVLRAVPILGLVPVVQMMFGVSEYGKIGLIAWAVMFPVWLSVEVSMTRKMEDQELYLVSAGLSRKKRFQLFEVPRLLGGLLAGIDIGIGIAWLAVVASEWIGTYSSGFWGAGLGYRLIVEYEANDWSGLILVLSLFGAMGLGSNHLWRRSLSVVFDQIFSDFDPRKWVESG